MFNYLYDHKKEVLFNIPPAIRKSRLVIFMYSLIHPMTWLYAEFLVYREESLKAVKLNSQQAILANYLNDLFDPALRRIDVFTPDNQQQKTIAYRKNEGPRTDAFRKNEGFKTLAYLKQDFSLSDFIVNIPEEVSSGAVSQVVEKYKIATKTFDIVTL